MAKRRYRSSLIPFGVRFNSASLASDRSIASRSPSEKSAKKLPKALLADSFIKLSTLS
jgi:hypothetical protein